MIPFLAFWFFCGAAVVSLLDQRNPTGEPGKGSNGQMSILPINGALFLVFAGKLKKPYPVTLSENLLEWLQPYMSENGSIMALDRNRKPNALLAGKLVP